MHAGYICLSEAAGKNCGAPRGSLRDAIRTGIVPREMLWRGIEGDLTFIRDENFLAFCGEGNINIILLCVFDENLNACLRTMDLDAKGKVYITPLQLNALYFHFF